MNFQLNCLNFTAPKTSEVEKTIYKHANECYKFKAMSKPCNKDIQSVRFA